MSSPSPDRWQLIESVFDQIADEPPERQSELLAKLTQDDSDLRREVESLLVHDRHDTTLPIIASNQVVESLAANGASKHSPGDQIDNLRLLYCLAANSNSEV